MAWRLIESPERYTARIRGVGGFLGELSPELLAVLAEQQARKPAALGSILLMPLGGAVARVPNDATPFLPQDNNYTSVGAVTVTRANLPAARSRITRWRWPGPLTTRPATSDPPSQLCSPET